MTEQSKKNIEQNMNDLFDRASVCPCDSEDFTKYEKQAAEFGKLLVEDQKNRMMYDLEEKKLELERERLRYENSIINPKHWIPSLLTAGVTVFTLWFNRNTLREHRRETMNFEQTGEMFTTIAGRSNSGIFGNLLKIGGGKGQI